MRNMPCLPLAPYNEMGRGEIGGRELIKDFISKFGRDVHYDVFNAPQKSSKISRVGNPIFQGICDVIPLKSTELSFSLYKDH